MPCPYCGVLTREGEYGSYEICPVCDWEDDPVQLANPATAGGANSDSLAEAQGAALMRHPFNVQVATGYRRGSSWRPLSATEVASAEARKASKPWCAKAVLSKSEAYWAVPLPGL
ncbi:MAG: hypothetical protein CFE41_18730 [Burkholderiales bacterium PBB2]|nr:MAG: hypothetical protein CFE41_18730 [Burkholderiales bacterium PBB2]